MQAFHGRSGDTTESVSAAFLAAIEPPLKRDGSNGREGSDQESKASRPSFLPAGITTVSHCWYNGPAPELLKITIRGRLELPYVTSTTHHKFLCKLYDGIVMLFECKTISYSKQTSYMDDPPR